MFSYHVMRQSRPLRGAAFALMTLLTGCASGSDALVLEPYKPGEVTYREFPVCHGYGCKYETTVRFSGSQWAQATAPLAAPAPDAPQERQRIAKAIAIMETLVGEATGTQTDQPGADFIVEDPGQMDCIDEAYNSSLYLHLMQQDNLLRWHRLSTPARRGYFVDGRWPHNTATITENATGQRYVVDSWFLENGREPFLLPVEEWLAGWHPPS